MTTTRSQKQVIMLSRSVSSSMPYIYMMSMPRNDVSVHNSLGKGTFKEEGSTLSGKHLLALADYYSVRGQNRGGRQIGTIKKVE